MTGLFKINEDSAFGPGMMFGITGPGPKADSPKQPSDKKKEKGITLKQMKKTIPSFKKFNEGFAYVKDPFREGVKIFSKDIKIDNVAVININGSIDGLDATHTAIVSVITSTMDNFGEDLGKERIILTQKDFTTKAEAESFLTKIEKEIIYK